MATNPVTTAEFENEVLQSEVPVLLDFWASWCGPCRMLAPTIEEIADEAEGFKVMSVNADEEPALVQRFGIQGIPTLIVIKDGEEYNRSIGVIPKDDILALLD